MCRISRNGDAGVDGSLGEDNVDFDNDEDVVAGIVGVVLEICDDVGVGFGCCWFFSVLIWLEGLRF